MPQDPDSKWLTASEVAVMVDLHEATVRRMADDGRLPPSRKIPRKDGKHNRLWKREDVEREIQKWKGTTEVECSGCGEEFLIALEELAETPRCIDCQLKAAKR